MSQEQTMYQERLYFLERAIERAENGNATAEDFDIIRFESGASPKQPSHTRMVLNDLFNDWNNIFGERE